MSTPALQADGTALQQRVDALIVELRGRARTSRNWASTLLFLITVLIGFGAFFFWFADDFVRREAAKDLEEVSALIGELSSDTTRLGSSIQREKEELEKALKRHELESDENLKHPEKAKGSVPVPILQLPLAQLEAEKTRKENTLGILLKAKAAIGARAASPDDWIRTAVLRAGVMLLLVFLVQLLISVYRFHSRTGGHYDAVADALQLITPHTDISTLPALVNGIRPNADFGKDVRTLPQEVIDLVRVASKQ